MKRHTPLPLTLLVLTLAACSAAPKASDLAQPDASVLLNQVNTLRANGAICQGRTLAAQRPLRYDARLERGAGLKATYIAQTGDFNHITKTGQDIDAFFQAAGYPVGQVSGIGEVLARDTAPDAPTALSTWQASTQGHCEALLDGTFDTVGFASATASDGRTIWVGLLARE